MSDVLVQFPHDKIVAASVMFHPQLTSKSGGISVTGAEQVVQSSAGRWGATLSFEVGHRFSRIDAQSRDPDSVLVWRAILALLEGRSNVLLIGPYDDLNTPGAIAGTDYGGYVAHSDATEFSDGSVYSQGGTPAEVAAAYAAGATTMSIKMLAGHSPEAGQYFSILDRMHIIKRATADADVANQWSLTVWPPAREALTASQVRCHVPANFSSPQCKMRLATDDTGQLALRQLYRSSPTIELVEASA